MTYNVMILMATYNGANYIQEQLDSIIAQTFDNWYLIIRDDDSQDDTFEILEIYKEKYPNKILLLKNNNTTEHGAKYNFSYLLYFIKDYSFDFVMFSDQDDIWSKDKIESGLKLLIKHNLSEPMLYYSDLFIVDSSLNKIHDSFMKFRNIKENKSLNSYLVENSVTGCTVIFNKALFDILPEINADRIILHDWFLALVAILMGKIVFDSHSHIMYRQHNRNEVGAKNPYTLRNLKSKLFQKNYLFDELQQCAYIYETFNKFLEKKDLLTLKRFLSLPEKNLFMRIQIMLKYKFLKTGLIRNIVTIMNLKNINK